MGFANLFKISIYSLSLSLTIQALFKLFQLQLPYFWVLFYGVAIFYLIKSIKTVNTVLEEEATNSSV